MSNEQFKSRLQLGMVLSVIAWGIYLATGAVLYNEDYRKGLIILGCTALFMALWWAAYSAARRRMQPGRTAGDGGPEGWNFASAFGFLIAAVVTSAMASAAWGWQAPGAVFAAMFGCAAISAIANVVGLSNTRRKPGRWLGLVGLGLLAASFVIGFYV